MCISCADEYDLVEVPADQVDELINLIDELYDHAPAGGPLHVELDDWNLDTDWAPMPSEHDNEELDAVVKQICTKMLALDVGQRAYVLTVREQRDQKERR